MHIYYIYIYIYMHILYISTLFFNVEVSCCLWMHNTSDSSAKNHQFAISSSKTSYFVQLKIAGSGWNWKPDTLNLQMAAPACTGNIRWIVVEIPLCTWLKIPVRGLVSGNISPDKYIHLYLNLYSCHVSGDACRVRQRLASFEHYHSGLSSLVFH